MPKIRFVFFDLDGTLRDTRDLMYSSLQAALEQHTGRHHTKDEIRPHIHYHQAVHEALAAEVPFADFEKTFQDLYEEGRASIQLYDGAVALLDALRARGLRLAVVTSARTVTSKEFVAKHNIHTHFDVISGMQDGMRAKPAPDLVLKALADLPCETDEAVMIGDTPADIGAAHAAGMRCIAITHGLGKLDELTAAGADHIIHSLDELPAALDHLDQ